MGLDKPEYPIALQCRLAIDTLAEALLKLVVTLLFALLTAIGDVRLDFACSLVSPPGLGLLPFVQKRSDIHIIICRGMHLKVSKQNKNPLVRQPSGSQDLFTLLGQA